MPCQSGVPRHVRLQRAAARTICTVRASCAAATAATDSGVCGTLAFT